MTTEHFTVFRDPLRYAGWPANYGMWAWDDEIVLLFTAGYPDPAGGFHARDRSRPLTTMQARSLDGGETWSVTEAPLEGAVGLGTYEHQDPDVNASIGLPEFKSPDGLRFDSPGFAAMCGRTGLRAGTRSWFYVTEDRCKTWQGPFELPMFGQLGIAARTDWLIDGPQSATLLLTATKPDGDEGRVFAARTEDGGASFEFLSWINESPERYEIMPASVRLDDGTVITAVRCQGSKHRNNWIDVYKSSDDCRSWNHLSRAVDDTGDGGNPASLNLLADGRLLLVYGSRKPPFSICATVSEDGGATWSTPRVLRDDGGNHDIGYPRTVVRADGKAVTSYYFNDSSDGERYIAATVFKP